MHLNMKATVFLTLFALPFAFAKEGDRCTFAGIQGTCKKTNECTAGFFVSKLCPNDPANVKCCVSKACTSTDRKPGTCLNDLPGKCPGTLVTRRCPGPNDVKCCVGGAGVGLGGGAGGGSILPPPGGPTPRDDVVVDFWINAFIPLDVAGVTKPWPNNPGKTMINGIPVIGDCFLTDQRDFSSAVGAKARMHSQTQVWIKPSLPGGYKFSQQHFCGETTEVDCEDGDVEDTKTQNNDNMAFGVTSGSASRVVLDFKAARSNPLVFASPDIDLKGTLTVDRLGKFVEFVGQVDEFPAFEAYASINGGPPRAIAQLGPKPGAGPSSLIGDANRDFRGRLTF